MAARIEAEAKGQTALDKAIYAREISLARESAAFSSHNFAANARRVYWDRVGPS